MYLQLGADATLLLIAARMYLLHNTRMYIVLTRELFEYLQIEAVVKTPQRY
jgi:hypothetical protein